MNGMKSLVDFFLYFQFFELLSWDLAQVRPRKTSAHIRSHFRLYAQTRAARESIGACVMSALKITFANLNAG
jgi:hypothetical protein